MRSERRGERGGGEAASTLMFLRVTSSMRGSDAEVIHGNSAWPLRSREQTFGCEVRCVACEGWRVKGDVRCVKGGV